MQGIVLCCTELPLLLRDATLASAGGQVVRLVDPTEVLARCCVAYALGASGAPRATLPGSRGAKVERACG